MIKRIQQHLQDRKDRRLKRHYREGKAWAALQLRHGFTPAAIEDEVELHPSREFREGALDELFLIDIERRRQSVREAQSADAANVERIA